MSLVKSPILTAAKLAANRRNARKSTGPRTRRGKARVTLNALKHGRYASKFFRSHLVLNREEVGLYDWFYREIVHNLGPANKQQWQQAEGLAREVWCFFREARRQGVRTGGRPPRSSSVWCLLRIPTCLTGGFGTIPRYAVKSTDTYVTFPSLFDIPIGKQGMRLRFWTRRSRRWLDHVFASLPSQSLERVQANLWERINGWLGVEAAPVQKMVPESGEDVMQK